MLNEDKKQIKIDKLEFNTYYIFKKENQDVKEIVGLIFKDYIEKLKTDKK